MSLFASVMIISKDRPMNVSEALTEEQNIIELAEHLINVWESDKDDYAAITQALTASGRVQAS